MADDETKKKYERAKVERDTHVGKILASRALKKVVVAGPGTGKTHLFKKVLDGRPGSLTLTFVNALVEDLSLELYGTSEVRTLHSFARGLLRSIWKKDINIFPKLSSVIGEDAEILLQKEIDFDKVFHERDDENADIEFYKKRKKYYDESYGYSDIIFAAAKYLESNPKKIPKYEQVVVDEFQDFNQLEVSLIDLLAEHSPILLAGDDDQALYEFKSASAKHIRERHDKSDSGYEAFNLPFCSRCTRVIVDAANDIVAAAMKEGLLQGRIKKPYQYFEDEEKDKISEQYPCIVYEQLFANKIPWFIANKVDEIAREAKGKFSILIISPTKVQSRMIAIALKKKGFQKVEYADKDNDREATLLDGLKILIEDDKSNLGWRIAAKFLMSTKEFEGLLKETNKDDTKEVHELVTAGCKKEVKTMVALLKKIRNNGAINEASLSILEKIGLTPYKIIRDSLAEELIGEVGGINAGLRKLPIKATTIQSSKGLSADYVFITHFDDAFFISKGGVLDRDICNFLVALTRAKRKVFLVSSQKKQPTFLKWIKSERIE